jgi:hypothetical protein
MGMKEERANNIIESAEHPLGFAILWGCVRARETQDDAAGSEE